MIKAKKSLGQNFLTDKNVIKKIVDLIDIKNKTVLEIGPGTGNLTSALIKKNPKKMHVIEKDDSLADLLEKEYSNQINIINDDILNCNESLISEEKLIVFGNLPYNISTEILCKWILNLNDKKIWFSNLILMFQKEVADRILSDYNTSNYGRLSVLTNWRLNVKKIFDITPNCFYPKPKVNSSVVIFEPKVNRSYKIKDILNLEKVTQIFFSNRRKMINKNLMKLFKNNEIPIKRLNIDLNKRPGELNNEDFYRITIEYEKLFN